MVIQPSNTQINNTVAAKCHHAVIRQLTYSDVKQWKAIRLEMLRSVPEAFGASFEEEMIRSDAEWESTLVSNDIFGAFVEDALVGTVGFYVRATAKQKHIGGMWGVYVRPAFCGHGLAKRLLSAVIEHAHTRVMQINCIVVLGNAAALALYQHHGFVEIGMEPNALHVHGRFYDAMLMVKVLSSCL